MRDVFQAQSFFMKSNISNLIKLIKKMPEVSQLSQPRCPIVLQIEGLKIELQERPQCLWILVIWYEVELRTATAP